METFSKALVMNAHGSWLAKYIVGEGSIGSASYILMIMKLYSTYESSLFE